MPEFRNKYLHLIIDEEAKLMYSEWVRKPTSEEYREAASILARHFREYTIEFWLQDTNCLGKVSPDDMKIVLQELVPVAAASTLKKLARITSDDDNMSAFLDLAKESNTELNTNVEVRQFRTFREAADWLQE